MENTFLVCAPVLGLCSLAVILGVNTKVEEKMPQLCDTQRQTTASVVRFEFFLSPETVNTRLSAGLFMS